MTEHLHELADLPVWGVFDGELVAFGDDGRPDFEGVAFALEAFDNGEALWEAVCEQRLEGVGAKGLDERYRPGERRWVSGRIRWARYEREREVAIEARLRDRRLWEMGR